MSMIGCDNCDQMIDSDDDPACFVEAPACAPHDMRKILEQVLCENCREREWERQQERAAETSP